MRIPIVEQQDLINQIAFEHHSEESLKIFYVRHLNAFVLKVTL